MAEIQSTPVTVSKRYTGVNAAIISQYLMRQNIGGSTLVDCAVREYLKRRGLEMVD